MYIILSIIVFVVSVILQNDAMMQTSGIFGIAGAIELFTSSFNKKTVNIEQKTEIKPK